MMPVSRLWSLMIIASAFGASCGDFIPNGVGERCSTSQDCTLRLCSNNICLDPSADDDGDGISNSIEDLWDGDPLSIDSDGDGDLDSDEYGDGPDPLDTDGDGTPDFVESSFFDADRDCIGDEADSDDTVANTDPEILKLTSCPGEGICADQLDVISAECFDGVLTCDYTQVFGFQPFAETSCDGLDGDCDGLTDEDFLFGGAPPGSACSPAAGCGVGIVVCAAGGAQATCSIDPESGVGPGFVEVCDLLDNDCDGETDEGYDLQGLPIGAPCAATGLCEAAPGIVECTAGGELAVCSTAPGGSQYPGQPESCDGVDNDCDGQTDEGLVWPAPDGETAAKGEPCGAGQCAFGVVVCDSDGAAVCSSELFASAELCDGLDNDCDGETDEDILYFGAALGEPCTGIGECGAGTVECVAGTSVATCSTNANGSAPEILPELCDGLDNDCDGATDDALNLDGIPKGGACDGECGNGVVECGAGRNLLCSTSPGGSAFAPVDESCNDLDDNCDGETDEGLFTPWAGEWSEFETEPPLPGDVTLAVPIVDPTSGAIYLVQPRFEGSSDESTTTWQFDPTDMSWTPVAIAAASPSRPDVAPSIVWAPEFGGLVGTCTLDGSDGEADDATEVFTTLGEAGWSKLSPDTVPPPPGSSSAGASLAYQPAPSRLWYLNSAGKLSLLAVEALDWEAVDLSALGDATAHEIAWSPATNTLWVLASDATDAGDGVDVALWSLETEEMSWSTVASFPTVASLPVATQLLPPLTAEGEGLVRLDTSLWRVPPSGSELPVLGPALPYPTGSALTVDDGSGQLWGFSSVLGEVESVLAHALTRACQR